MTCFIVVIHNTPLRRGQSPRWANRAPMTCVSHPVPRTACERRKHSSGGGSQEGGVRAGGWVSLLEGKEDLFVC